LIRWLWTPIPDDEAHRRLDDVDFARMPRMTR
jgi:hypothetical protein